jgi:hypothetical protein
VAKAHARGATVATAARKFERPRELRRPSKDATPVSKSSTATR